MNFTSKLWLWKIGEASRGGVSLQLTRWRLESVFCRPEWCSRKFFDKDMHCELTGQMGVKKYLRKSCYHHIECSATNSLATFMWKRPLNSPALVTPTHRGPVRVSDGTSTQVVTWTIDKWRAKIIQREIYNVRDPWGKGDREIEGQTL